MEYWAILLLIIGQMLMMSKSTVRSCGGITLIFISVALLCIEFFSWLDFSKHIYHRLSSLYLNIKMSYSCMCHIDSQFFFWVSLATYCVLYS